MANTDEFSQKVSIHQVWPKFETIDQALKRRDTLVRQLRNGDISAQQFAANLATCKDHRRCDSPICPICVRELRSWFISEAIGCIEDLRSTNPSGLSDRVIRLLGIPCEEYRFGSRSLPNLQRLNKTLQKRFQRDEFPLVFAGVDVSLNLFNNSITRARWQPHLYGLVVGLTRDEVKAALSAYYPPRKRARKPLYVTRCNSLAAVL